MCCSNLIKVPSQIRLYHLEKDPTIAASKSYRGTWVVVLVPSSWAREGEAVGETSKNPQAQGHIKLGEEDIFQTRFSTWIIGHRRDSYIIIEIGLIRLLNNFIWHILIKTCLIFVPLADTTSEKSKYGKRLSVLSILTINVKAMLIVSIYMLTSYNWSFMILDTLTVLVQRVKILK